MLLPPSNLRILRDELKRTGYAHSFRVRPKSSYGRHNYVSAKVEKCLNYEKSHLHQPKNLDIAGAGFKSFGPDITTGVSSFGSCYNDIPLLSTKSMQRQNGCKKEKYDHLKPKTVIQGFPHCESYYTEKGLESENKIVSEVPSTFLNNLE